MKLTPLDIHHKEFRTSLRGYSEKEVDSFLDEVADEFDRLFKENVDLNERIQATLERIKSYEDMKETLQNTLIVAQTHAEAVETDAGKRSDLLLREAELKAQQIVAEALAEKQRIQQEVMRVKRAGEQYREALALMLERHLAEVSDVEVPADFPTEEDVAETREQITEATTGARPVAPTAPTAPSAAQVSYAAAVAQAEEGPAPVAPAPVAQAEEPAGAPAPAPVAAPAPAPVAETPRVAPAPIPPKQADTPAPAPLADAAARTTVMPSVQSPVQGGVQQPVVPQNATSLTLGEVGSPAPADDALPIFTDPAEFELPSFGTGFGQADEDVDIEEID